MIFNTTRLNILRPEMSVEWLAILLRGHLRKIWYYIPEVTIACSRNVIVKRKSWTWPSEINSLAPGRSKCDFKNVIFNLALLIGIFKSSYDKVLRWMPQDLTDDKSTLIQVMAWCRQATSHYLKQCWPRSPTPCGVIKPQCVKTSTRAIW